MEHPLFIYNTLTRRKEHFVPLSEPMVGMYVCGPTVYGDPHLGHTRPAITFDVLFRYLQQLGYKVRYVRNITDVGHLEHDADEGEDKIAKKARLEQLEPMEVAQYYTNRFHDAMRALNCLPPSIEPHATGHIIEQIELVKEILKNGYAYESQGSVYFDVEKYNEKYRYGRLSGRNLTDVINNSRELDGQSEKHNQVDFALWKAAQPEHIMRWPSPWSDGFPGWHCECTAMGRKYLGSHFDIHGGGMDLVFPHHECEIAQAVASQGSDIVNYWMHCNMVTIGGQKMGKSLGNFITLNEFFTGTHEKLSQAYSPMTIRFFILQAHYRSTVDFSNEALQAAEKGLEKLQNAIADLDRIIPSGNSGDSGNSGKSGKSGNSGKSGKSGDSGESGNSGDAETLLQDLTVSVNNLDLGELTGGLAMLPNISGTLNGDYHLMMDEKHNISVASDMGVTQMAFEGSHIGNLGSEFVYLLREDGTHVVDATLMLDDTPIGTLQGSYLDGKRLDADLELTHMPLSIVNGFMPDQLLGFEGAAGGDGLAAETHEVVDAEVVDVVVVGGALTGEILADIVAVDTDGGREVR